MGKADSNHLLLVDYSKGALLSLVMIGHILFQPIDDNILRYAIYSFHVPLFLALSGFLRPQKRLSKYTLKALFYKYWFRMLLPWLIAFIVYTSIHLAQLYYFQGTIPLKKVFVLVLYPYYHLWYVPVLMGMIVALWIITKYKINLVLIIIVSVFITLLWKLYHSYFDDIFIIKLMGDKRLYFLFSFFFIGHLLRTLPVRVNNILLLLSCLFLYSLRIVCFYKQLPILLIEINWLLLNISLILLLLGNIDGSTTKVLPLNSLFTFIGKYSLPIYLWHVIPTLILQSFRLHQITPLVYYSIGVVGIAALLLLIRLYRNDVKARKWFYGYAD